MFGALSLSLWAGHGHFPANRQHTQSDFARASLVSAERKDIAVDVTWLPKVARDWVECRLVLD